MNTMTGSFYAWMDNNLFDVTGFTYSNDRIYMIGLKVLCLGQVPPSTFVIDTFYHYDNCSNHINYCVSCISATVCL